MKIENNHIIADDGYMLLRINTDITAKEVWLGKYDKADNWAEITEEEAQKYIDTEEESNSSLT